MGLNKERKTNSVISLPYTHVLSYRWTFGLLGLLNCCRITPFPSHLFLTISSALAIAPLTPLSAGVSTSSAPIVEEEEEEEEKRGRRRRGGRERGGEEEEEEEEEKGEKEIGEEKMRRRTNRRGWM